MILRDHLALERTALANERTLLSYGRTALAMIISGASGIHFLEGPAFQLVGGLLIASGLVVLGIGVRQHRSYRGRIEYIRVAARARRQLGKGTVALWGDSVEC
jgi:putative membrane protein